MAALPIFHSLIQINERNHRMKRIHWTAKRVALGVFLSLAMTAAAFFVATYLSEGSKEAKTGTAGNLPMAVTVDFPDGQLTPTTPVKVTATVNNTSGAPRVWKSFPMSIKTPTVPICGEQWLELYAQRDQAGVKSEAPAWSEIIKGTNSTAMAPIATGVQNIFNTANGELEAVYLRFKPGLIAGTNQKSCENVPVVVTGKLTE
jgi:hypothetical protein